LLLLLQLPLMLLQHMRRGRPLRGPRLLLLLLLLQLLLLQKLLLLLLQLLLQQKLQLLLLLLQKLLLLLLQQREQLLAALLLLLQQLLLLLLAALRSWLLLLLLQQQMLRGRPRRRPGGPPPGPCADDRRELPLPAALHCHVGPRCSYGISGTCKRKRRTSGTGDPEAGKAGEAFSEAASRAGHPGFGCRGAVFRGFRGSVILAPGPRNVCPGRFPQLRCVLSRESVSPESGQGSPSIA